MTQIPDRLFKIVVSLFYLVSVGAYSKIASFQIRTKTSFIIILPLNFI
jgi:hypothetical protein